MSFKPQLHSIECREFHAVIRREPQHVNVGDLFRGKEISQSCRVAVVVVKEPAVAVDVTLGSLLKDLIDVLSIQISMELRPSGSGDAVIWPRNLFDSV